MPRYVYDCKCGSIEEVYRSMDECTNTVVCPSCGLEMHRVYGCNTPLLGFNEYTEDRFNGEPILVKSPKHRDELCKQHHATYDDVKYFRKPKAPEIEVSLGEVLEAMNERGSD